MQRKQTKEAPPHVYGYVCWGTFSLCKACLLTHFFKAFRYNERAMPLPLLCYCFNIFILNSPRDLSLEALAVLLCTLDGHPLLTVLDVCEIKFL